MTRRAVGGIVILAFGLLLAPLDAVQPAAKVPRVGILALSHRPTGGPFGSAFVQSLREGGYVDGQTNDIQGRMALDEVQQLPLLAAELVNLPVDVLLTLDHGALQAAKQATTTIPIIGVALETDPVASGLVASLSRPGGNITGVFFDVPEFSGKQLQLLKEAVPAASRVAVLWNSTYPSPRPWLKPLEGAAQLLGIQLQPFDVRSTNDLEGAFEAATRWRAEAVMVLPSPLFWFHRGRIVNYVRMKRLPAMYQFKEFAEAGGLMSYGPNGPEMARRAAVFVDKILKGAKSADLPVERPTKFELVINLKTAQALGLMIPPALLFQADEVIR